MTFQPGSVGYLLLMCIGGWGLATSSFGECPLPDLARPAAAKPAVSGKIVPARVYIDSSYSMIGYARAATEQRQPYADSLETLASYFDDRGGAVQYVRFDKTITPLKGGLEDARRFSRVAAYECGGCNNESHIDQVLGEIKSLPANSFNVVVTDLWLSSQELRGSAQAVLGQPITQILSQGRSIAIIGLRAPFSGKVYNVPRVGTYDGGRGHPVTERPLFILLIGPKSEVETALARLKASNSPSYADKLFYYSVFSTKPVSTAKPSPVALQLSGQGVRRQVTQPAYQKVPQYIFKLRSDGAIFGEIDSAKGIDRGTVWSGRLLGSTEVWKLSGGLPFSCPRWIPLDSHTLRAPWGAVANSVTQARFTLSPATAANLRPNATYLIRGKLGPRDLASPNPANDWMRKWGFSEPEASSEVMRHPAFFKTLYLGDLATIMEQAVQRARNGQQAPTVSFTVIVKTTS